MCPSAVMVESRIVTSVGAAACARSVWPRLCDDAFTAGLRTVTERHRHGTVTTPDVVAAFAAAAGSTPGDVLLVTGPWIDEPGVPALP